MYYRGVLFALGYTLFSTLNWFEMRRMGFGVHSSIKTYYFGLLCSIGAFMWLLVFETPGWFDYWFYGGPIPLTLDQTYAAFGIVGFFSWANQETLSLCLTVVMQGTATAFNGLALIVSFCVQYFCFHTEIYTFNYVGGTIIIIFTAT